MTRCQEAAFASVLLTVPWPWLGSFVCSAHVCKVCVIVGSCMCRGTRVAGCAPYEPLPGCLWHTMGTGRVLCARGDQTVLPQRAAARESCSFAELRLPEEGRECVLLEKHLCLHSRSFSDLACSFSPPVLIAKVALFSF